MSARRPILACCGRDLTRDEAAHHRHCEPKSVGTSKAGTAKEECQYKRRVDKREWYTYTPPREKAKISEHFFAILACNLLTAMTGMASKTKSVKRFVARWPMKKTGSRMHFVSGRFRTASTQAPATGEHWKMPPSSNAIHHAAMNARTP